MKKRVIATLLLSATLLTGCGSDESTDAKENSGTETSSAFTGEKVAKIKDAEGNENVATVTFENGKAIEVEIDVIQADGSSKYEAAETGAYAMNGESGNEWHTQVDLLEDSIVENDFDLSKITMTEEGKTDAVSGVSISVTPYMDLVEEALNQK